MFKKLFIFILTTILLMSFIPLEVSAGEIIYTGYTVGAGNIVTVNGIKSDGGQVTFMVKSGENIIFLDQKGTVNNEFSFTFKAPVNNTQKQYLVRIGGTGIATPFETTISVTQYKAIILDVEDNSIRVGKDVYGLSSTYLTPENITKSMAESGNNDMYYKIGGKWYDLNSPLANSVNFFTPANAIPDATVNAWRLNYWHPSNPNNSKIIFR